MPEPLDPLEEIRREQREQKVRAYLEQMSKDGTRITVEGYDLSLPELVKVLTFSEGVCYMPDYLKDERGNPEIRFIRVYLT